MLVKCLSACLISVVWISPGYNQTIEKKTYHTEFTKIPPVLDGLMNDSCWNQVEWGENFIQIQPSENVPPTHQTAFKILFDDNNLYVFIRAFDTEPNKISKIISRRDNFDGDQVAINIDSYFDKQTAFSFTASSTGVKGDEAVTQDGNNWDDSWNPIWFLESSIDDKGWCAEIRIPFSQLRFGKKTEHVWGIQISRRIYRSQERSAWQYIPKGSPGLVHLFGELKGIENIKPNRRIELMPYAVGRLQRFAKEEGNPFLTGKSSSFSAGLDGKAAITNDLTLDFTINPDFGQVEADPSEVNLTAFETYFSERRPFFVEGKNIYQFQPTNTIVIGNMYADNLFYSRRIGRYPQYSPKTTEGEYVKMPEASSIIAALKLSGKTRKGLSIGILESITANENATIDSAGVRRKESVEPLTSYYVARVQQDFNKGETVLGGLFTAVNRDINNPAMDFLTNSAYTGGIDFQHTWKERTWYVSGNAEFSNISGKTDAMLTAQTSSARYFQRPDARHVSVDSSLNSLTGYGSTLKLGRNSKQHIQFETSLTVRSPGLEFNDIGYMRYTDVMHHGTWVAYYIRDPFAIFNNFYLNTNYWMYWNFGGELLSTHANMNFNSEFKNKWRINGSYTRTSESLSTTLLRGGPSMIMPGSWDLNLYVSTNQSKILSLYTGTYIGLGDANSNHANDFAFGVTVRPMNAMMISFEPDIFTQHSKLQYVETASFDGKPRYVFADLVQKTINFTFRLNYSVNPELTIEYYGQPFISAGEYTNFKLITDPKAEQFEDRYDVFEENNISYSSDLTRINFDENMDAITDYSVSNPNFNVQQFRSNLVIRWEYLPGSTIFLVWSQSRNYQDSSGSFAYGENMKQLFTTQPNNVFLLKFSYWFSL